MSALKVFLVDDEPDVRRAIERLLRAEGLDVEGFGSATEFLAAAGEADGGCVVLDVAMPGVDGLELQQLLADRRGAMPVVFLSGRGDIAMTVHAIKAGAVDFLTKPVRGADLLHAVRAALGQAAEHRRDADATADSRARLAQLTPREREVLGHVISGQRNKTIAARLGTSEQTIKVHRGRMMDKLGVDSVVGLVHIAQSLGVTETR